MKIIYNYFKFFQYTGITPCIVDITCLIKMKRYRYDPHTNSHFSRLCWTKGNLIPSVYSILSDMLATYYHFCYLPMHIYAIKLIIFFCAMGTEIFSYAGMLITLTLLHLNLPVYL